MPKKICVLSALFFSIFIFGGCTENLPEPPFPPLKGYAATLMEGVYKTENGGQSWFPIEANQEAIRGYYKRIYLCPWDPDQLFIATTGAGVYILDLKSNTLKELPESEDQVIRAIAFRQDKSTRRWGVFFGSNDKGVYKAMEDAFSWSLWNDGLPYHYITALMSMNNRLYAGTVKGLFSRQLGESVWQPCSNGLGNKHIYSLAAAHEGETIYLGAGPFEGEKGLFSSLPPTVYKSTDQGRTWASINSDIPEDALVYDIAVYPEPPEYVYLGTSNGVYHSTDQGETWHKKENGLPKGYKALNLQVVPLENRKDSAIYSVGPDGAFMTTLDEKTGWIYAGYGLPPTSVTDIGMVSR